MATRATLFGRRARTLLMRAGGATSLVAAGAASLVAAAAHCDAAPNSLSSVAFEERPRDMWIEVEQRDLADSFVNWTNPDMEYIAALKALRSAYAMPSSTMAALKDHFLAEAKAGLAGLPGASLRMLPTFVTQRVTGAERGDYYALDLGGTNFRVLEVKLLGNGKVGPITQAKFSVPLHIKTGSGEELFGFLADSVASFLAKECGGNPSGKLGFTFSFPTE